MATKKATRKPASTTPSKGQEVYSARNSRSKFSFADYINITESYTSLILGIVVVIIASILLVSFFKNRHIGNFPGKQDISAISTINMNEANNSTESAEIVAQNPTDTLSPTVTEAPTPTVTKTPATSVKPTGKPTTVPTAEPTKIAVEKSTNPVAGTYKVKAGETLWSIAEKQYKDGYKWVEIAQANNLSNPNVIHSDLSLKLPKIETEAVAQNPEKADTQMNAPNQAGERTYTVTKGDDLWDIAVKQYNNGYRWVDIARANNLVNPNTIHSGNVLKIPR